MQSVTSGLLQYREKRLDVDLGLLYFYTSNIKAKNNFHPSSLFAFSMNTHRNVWILQQQENGLLLFLGDYFFKNEFLW